MSLDRFFPAGRETVFVFSVIFGFLEIGDSLGVVFANNSIELKFMRCAGPIVDIAAGVVFGAAVGFVVIKAGVIWANVGHLKVERGAATVFFESFIVVDDDFVDMLCDFLGGFVRSVRVDSLISDAAIGVAADD